MTAITIDNLTPGGHSLHIQATRDQTGGEPVTTPTVEFPFTIN